MKKSDVEKFLKRGKEQLLSKNYSNAENCFSVILDQDSREVNALHLLGMTKVIRGYLDDGIKLILKSIEINPDQYEPLLNLGQIFKKTNEIEKSNLYLKNAADVDAQKADAWRLLAQNSYKATKIKTAIN